MLSASGQAGGEVVSGVIGLGVDIEEAPDPGQALLGVEGGSRSGLLELLAEVVPASALDDALVGEEQVHVGGCVGDQLALVGAFLADPQELGEVLAVLGGAEVVDGELVVAEGSELASMAALGAGLQDLHARLIGVDDVAPEQPLDDAADHRADQRGDVLHGVAHRGLGDGDAEVAQVLRDAHQGQVQSTLGVGDARQHRRLHRPSGHGLGRQGRRAGRARTPASRRPRGPAAPDSQTRSRDTYRRRALRPAARGSREAPSASGSSSSAGSSSAEAEAGSRREAMPAARSRPGPSLEEAAWAAAVAPHAAGPAGRRPGAAGPPSAGSGGATRPEAVPPVR